MFTGIVTHLGTVVAHERDGERSRLHLATGGAASDLEDGGSLAVDGVCLTALSDGLRAPGADFAADVMGETLGRSALGSLEPGARVNLERCLAAGGRFDGHIVQGHVDGVGRVLSAREAGGTYLLRVEVPAELAQYTVEKGSIALHGVSLTLVAVSEPGATPAWVEVGLIPATLDLTTFGALRPGDAVNLEVDVLAKHAAAIALRSQGTGSQGAGSQGTGSQGTGLQGAGSQGAAHAGPAIPRATAQDAPVAPAPAGTAGAGNVDAAIRAIAQGRPVVVVDSEDRENEGDLIIAAEAATPENLGFMVRYSSGVLCAPVQPERAEALGLPPMLAVNEDPKGTAYTVSCDAQAGVSTGISAADRARTARLLADPAATAADLTRPGHVFPLIARPGGVLERDGHTEAAVDLARLAGLEPAGVIAEIVHDDGSLMRRPALEEFAATHGLVLVTIEALADHLRSSGAPATHVARPTSPAVGLPTAHGTFTARTFGVDGVDYAVLSAPADDDRAPLVRVHSECLTGDVFGSRRCDCGEQRDAALARIAAEGGAFVYMTGHEGRGIGLAAKLAAYQLQDSGLDTVDANIRLGHEPDSRDYSAAGAILRALGHERVRLLSNNPAKHEALEALGIRVEGRVPLEVPARAENVGYLRTKQARMRHTLTIDNA